MSKFEAIASSGSDIVKTDIPQSTLGYFVKLAAKSRTLSITRMEITPAAGFDLDDPDFAGIQS
ncbi:MULTISPECIES: hypothetical protein [unclassified Cryobacterium]|uniref:hypothetical protein n=1 Tax=unclassified Cryobacterium TaxID=2649013 RepID=UPI002AB58014|nr:MULTISPECIES: hypothetical protein [unclassified Cryobacterium]MDY7544599.1 hypothetical protein [Cryobacterium sp. 5B3]MEB0000094.1 hypothetical protein [Cryobacterium sp. RTS3]MEB0266767.1 hypothetical protein [Cryobacterium sp. 10I5]MEB0275963.1 hypothetical protein [Cryobacterium sp. 5B3]